MSTTVRCLVRRDTYRDSVELMRVAAVVEGLPGVARAALMMATPANRQILAEADLLADDVDGASPNDLVVAVAAEDAVTADEALAHAASLLAGQSSEPVPASSIGERPSPRTIGDGLREVPGATLAIVSTPGPYATAEALKALKRGLHVFMFSDNVPLDDEIELKRLGRRKGLFVMGPDCGTAILDGVPIGFANAVRRGRIGLIGASGTGLQEVACLIDLAGEGVSQAIGVGGRDLHARVGGAMMALGIERLAADPATDVIVLVSKPPAPSVAAGILDRAGGCGKPVVVCFLGGDPATIGAAGLTPAQTLEDAAALAVAAARGEALWRPSPPHPLSRAGVRASGQGGEGLPAGGRWTISHVRGLFCGGTLCQEAGLILREQLDPGRFSVLDLGADEYTAGRPHPMIDPRLRNEQVVVAAEDPTTGVILVDVVIGYGANADPAGVLVPAVERARQVATSSGRTIEFVASVTGTEADPQRRSAQESTLRAARILVAPSNAAAARLAAELVGPGPTVESSRVAAAGAAEGRA